MWKFDSMRLISRAAIAPGVPGSAASKTVSRFASAFGEWNANKKAWEPIQIAPRTILHPSPKGGAKRSFSIPMSSELIKILSRRRQDNAAVFSNDSGWVFPSRALKDGTDRKERC
jgi:integrase